MDNHWNFRVIHEVTSIPDPDAPEERWGIHEVHYKDGKPYAYTENPVTVCSYEDIEGLSWYYETMAEAFDKPVLTPADFGLVPLPPVLPETVTSIDVLSPSVGELRGDVIAGTGKQLE
jgi:hypothetical protein